MNALFVPYLCATPASRWRSGWAPAFNAAVLYCKLRRTGIYQPEPGWARFSS